MTKKELADLYGRDIRKLIEEITAFKNEENIWKICGAINNSSGNIVLHIIGGLNYLIGATLSQSGYTRNREQEFIKKRIERTIIIIQMTELIPMIEKTISQLTEEQMLSPYPTFFDKEGATNSYVLTQLLLHLSYHLGQVNYLRRALE